MRITRDEWGLRLAEVTAERGTCLRRQVGCVLLDARGHVLATGYNGVAADMPHCSEMVKVPIHGPTFERTWNKKTFTTANCIGWDETYPNACPAASAASGTALDGCEAIHAEMNAIAQCADTWKIHTVCVTTSPCVNCVKVLMNTGATRLVFRTEYPHPSKELWQRHKGREWIHLLKEQA